MSGVVISHRQMLAWRVALACWLGLLVLLVAWEAWLAPIRPGGSWLVLKAAPLLLPLPGLLRRDKDAMQRALLIVFLYVLEGCVRFFEPPPYGTLAALELGLAGLFFTAAISYLRPFKRAAKAVPLR